MRIFLSLTVWAFLSLITLRAEDKPNIIYIVADDVGWKDVGFQGAKDILTPNIDKLASQAARLDQFYVQPMCTPTRAALMTGRYPMRYGLQTLVIPSKGSYGLAKDEYLLPQVLKDAGYDTAMVGKWHLGHADAAYWPKQRGFDYFYGAVLGEIDYFTREAHGVLDWQRNNKAVKEKGYVTELLGDDAVKVIDDHNTKNPLFLYLAFTAPHAPYQAPQKYIDRFSNIPNETRRTYAGMISCMDDQVGRVIAALKEKGMLGNSIIVFHSDNGGTRDTRLTGESKVKELPCDNSPLRGGKGGLYEGGTRVPAFIFWPGHIAAGELDGLYHITDMLPTLAAITGGSTAKCKPLDGSDVSASLTGKAPSPRSEIVYNIEPFRAAIREGDWKLVWRTVLPSQVELFNLKTDPNETTNVAAENPQIVQNLQSRIEKLSVEASKPLFFGTALDAVMAGAFGPATIPVEDEAAPQQP